MSDTPNFEETVTQETVTQETDATGKIQLTCSICLDYITENPLFTPCIHGFHKECLLEWIKSQIGQMNMLCPLCKTNMNEFANYLIEDPANNISILNNAIPSLSYAPMLNTMFSLGANVINEMPMPIGPLPPYVPAQYYNLPLQPPSMHYIHLPRSNLPVANIIVHDPFPNTGSDNVGPDVNDGSNINAGPNGNVGPDNAVRNIEPNLQSHNVQSHNVQSDNSGENPPVHVSSILLDLMNDVNRTFSSLPDTLPINLPNHLPNLSSGSIPVPRPLIYVFDPATGMFVLTSGQLNGQPNGQPTNEDHPD